MSVHSNRIESKEERKIITISAVKEDSEEGDQYLNVSGITFY